MQWPPGKTFPQAVGKILPKPCTASSLCNFLSLHTEMAMKMPQHPGTRPTSNAWWALARICHHLLSPTWISTIWGKGCSFLLIYTGLSGVMGLIHSYSNTSNKVSILSMLRWGSNDTRWCRDSFSENMTEVYGSFATIFSEATAEPRRSTAHIASKTARNLRWVSDTCLSLWEHRFPLSSISAFYPLKPQYLCSTLVKWISVKKALISSHHYRYYHYHWVSTEKGKKKKNSKTQTPWPPNELRFNYKQNGLDGSFLHSLRQSKLLINNRHCLRWE